MAYRQPGALHIDHAAYAVLGELRLLEGARRPAALDIEQIDGLERIFEVRLPDDLLAVLAARSRYLLDVWNLSLEHIADNCEHAWREIYRGEPSGALRDPDWLYSRGPFCVGRRWDGTLMLVPRRSAPEEPTVLRLWRAGEERRRGLADTLRDEVDQMRLMLDERQRVEAARAPRKVIPLAAQRFAPRLTGRQDERQGERNRRVRHASFGDGTVIAPSGREVSRGDRRKLAVRFDSGDTRVLLSRYVEWLD